MVFSFNAFADIEETIEKEFTLSGKGQLLVENVNGDVDIESWSQNTVKVTANITADNQEGRDRIKVNMKQSGDRVSVDTEYKSDNSWGNNSNGGSVDYVIMVPQNIDLKDIELVNGALTVKNVSGELQAELVNGSIDATGLASDVEVDSVNGGIELTFADSVKDVSIDIETVNGGVRLYVPDNFGAKVEASTGNGSIKTDFGLKGTKGQYWGTELEGSFGDGSSDIELESVNGSIKILKK